MIWVLGASGRIGGYLFSKFRQDGFSTIGTYCRCVTEGLIYFNLENMTLRDLLLTFKKPTHVIFCAAVNPRPELSADTAGLTESNVTNTIKLIECCFEENIVPVYFSTDNVFDGEKGGYSELDKTNPLNNYGKMKCEVEKFLLGSQKEYVLLRMGKVFGVDDTLLKETFIKLNNAANDIFATDQRFTPTYIEDLYDFIKDVVVKSYAGVFHIGSTSAVTRYEVAEKVKKYFGLSSEIKPGKINGLGLCEKRPVNIELNINKYLLLTGKKLQGLEYFFEKTIVEIDPEIWRKDDTGKSLAYFAKTKQVTVGRQLINSLIRLSAIRGNENIRFCLHNSSNEDLQDMIIIANRGKTCLRLHQHVSGKEAIHIIDGTVLALIFDESRALIEKRILKADGEFAYRNDNGTYHIYLPISDYVVLREVRNGSNRVGETAPPQWDWVEVVEKHLDAEFLTCNNTYCKTACKFMARL